MSRLLLRLFDRVLVGTCLVSLSLVFLSLAALLRLLPRLLHLIGRCLRGLLILSFRLYRLLLTRIAPPLQRRLRVDILDGPARLIASVVLSLALGALVLVLSRFRVTAWSIVLWLLHGLFVGLAWDEIEEPGGLRLGAKIQ